MAHVEFTNQRVSTLELWTWYIHQRDSFVRNSPSPPAIIVMDGLWISTLMTAQDIHDEHTFAFAISVTITSSIERNSRSTEE